MKKVAFILLSLVFITSYGCDNNTNNTDEKIGTEEKESKEVVESKTTEATGTIHLTKQDFLEKVMNYEVNQEWVFEGDKPCIIDFYADWCRPCKIAAPILEELAVEYAGKINIYKINTEKEQELAAVFGIQSIPAFLFCPKDGKPQMSAGIARTPEETKVMFRQLIEEQLLKN
jgi:thioredoxin